MTTTTLTNQEIFTKVVTHLRAQGTRAVGADGLCKYRAEGGAKCAVGCLINDEIDVSGFEGSGVSMPDVRNALIASGVPVPAWDDDKWDDSKYQTLSLLRSLQQTHDATNPKAWEADFKVIASRYGLKYTAKEMTLQEVFTKVVRHLRAQGRPARNASGNACLYRAPDGTQCAAGCLIDDDQYTDELEYRLAEYEEPKAALRASGVPEAAFEPKEPYGDLPRRSSLLSRLQATHDVIKPSDWESKFKEIANTFGLEVPTFTNQEIFTKVVRHLRKQGKKAMIDRNLGLGAKAWGCAYRGVEGAQCAAGCLITDEQYKPELEGGVADRNGSMKSNAVCDALVASGVPEDALGLVRALQQVHDSASEWEVGFDNVAKAFGLTVPTKEGDA